MKRSDDKVEENINYDSDRSDCSVEIGNDIPLIPIKGRSFTETETYYSIYVPIEERDLIKESWYRISYNDDGYTSDSSIEIMDTDDNIDENSLNDHDHNEGNSSYSNIEDMSTDDNINDNTGNSNWETIGLMQDYLLDGNSLYNMMFNLSGDSVNDICKWIED